MSVNPQEYPLVDGHERFQIIGQRVVIDNVVFDQRFCMHSMRFTYLVHQIVRGKLDPDEALDKIYTWMQAERVLHPNMAPKAYVWEGKETE